MNKVKCQKNNYTTLISETTCKNEKHGKQIYNENAHFKDIADIMNNEKTRCFYDRYLSNWTDTKTIIVLLKTYDILEKAYFEKNNEYASKYFLTYMLFEITKHKNYNKIIKNNMLEYMEIPFEMYKKKFTEKYN
jgi:hypothetical protein